ncbi:unnamed protein product, partial [Staurois parvus]
LHLAQCSQASTILLATTKPRHDHQIARQRSGIRHSREHVFTALEPSGSYALTPLCHFTWTTTLWSCCCSQLLPLCYREEI